MASIGQFAAVELSYLVPSCTYWLYWSPQTEKFAQFDEHD
jgi:hypothetical protein